MTDKTPEELNKAFWASRSNLSIDEVIDTDSPFWVDTAPARGSFGVDKLLAFFGYDKDTNSLEDPSAKRYVLFAGHVGCGKSTELRRFVKQVHHQNAYFVVLIDSYTDLDPNNLQYTDVLIALATKLCEKLREKDIDLDPTYLSNLKKWLDSHVITTTSYKEISGDLKVGASAKASIPFLATIFGNISSGIRGGAAIKDDLRRVIRATYTEFSAAFNVLLEAAEEALRQRNMARKILFAIDGTDRIDTEDTERFFVKDAYQLKQIAGNFIYTARIDILHENNIVRQLYDTVITVPMIKVAEKHDPEARIDIAYDTLRALIYRRVDADLFDNQDTVDRLITMSGGHPRDLMRLLNYTFVEAEGKRFTRNAADAAVHQLSRDYQRLLSKEDFDLLVAVDNEKSPATTDAIMKLLRNTVILEYNNYWWRTHPAVRVLSGYEDAKDRAKEQAHGG